MSPDTCRRLGRLFNPFPVQMRYLVRSDLPSIMAIERASFEFPWCEKDFVDQLRPRNVIAQIAETGGNRMTGFVIYELLKNRIQILNFAVDPIDRRRGVGRQMLKHLQANLSTQCNTRILTEVRETNLIAQLFLRSIGYRAVSTLHDYYEETKEDAYLFQYSLA